MAAMSPPREEGDQTERFLARCSFYGTQTKQQREGVNGDIHCCFSELQLISGMRNSFFEAWCLTFAVFQVQKRPKAVRLCGDASRRLPPVRPHLSAVTPSYLSSSFIGSPDGSVFEFQGVFRALLSAALRPGSEGRGSAGVTQAPGSPSGGTAGKAGDHQAASEPSGESRKGRYRRVKCTAVLSSWAGRKRSSGFWFSRLVFISPEREGETRDTCNTFLVFSKESKNIYTGIAYLLYYKFQCVQQWIYVFKWFYEICKGFIIDLNAVNPWLQLSQYTETAVKLLKYTLLIK